MKFLTICLLLTQTCKFEKSNNTFDEKKTEKNQKQERYESINKQFNTTKNCIICDSTEIFKTIEDVLNMNRFKNKVVYLDFWGTGCKPCIEEFEYLPDLKKKFQNKPIEYLYIIIYDKKKEWDTYRPMLWRMLIKKYKLTGINLLLTKDLKHRFIYKYKDESDPIRMQAVPKYILFNKKGEVVDFNAPRPSSKEVLYKKIQELLNE
ncbi:MAG: redoxin family protein [Draconibacterium sp.]|nr:redoxin family protein [Draconibacterium sp.]